MSLYQITLNQGRSDTIQLEASSLFDVRTFLESLTTANITSVKKVVYSKDLGIGSGFTTYIPNNQDSYLNVMVKSKKGYVGTLNLSYPIKNLTSETISKSIKQHLLINGDEIVDIVNIIKSFEGGSPKLEE